MLAIDVHQHLWPAEVLRGLERRATPPCAAWDGATWTVELPGEPAFVVDPAQHDAARRAADVRAAGLDRALVALSSPVGIEALPAGEAEPLLDAFAAAAASLPAELGWWAPVALAAAPAELAARAEAALDAGAAGVVLPTGALGSRADLEHLAPLLELLSARLAPLFVHPGPGAAGRALPAREAWWAPSTRYVAGLAEAWHAWGAWGRPEHPGLHVVFAALAGLAPLGAERTVLRGGPSGFADAPDELTFYDTSGYGPRALRWMRCAVGTGQLVHGSDAPVVAPPPDGLQDDERVLVRGQNVARLLGTAWVAA